MRRSYYLGDDDETACRIGGKVVRAAKVPDFVLISWPLSPSMLAN